MSFYADIDQLRNVQRTKSAVEYRNDQLQEALDNAACAEYDRREAIANAVTFADVIEEMASFSDARAEEFMSALHRGMQPGKNTVFVLIDQAMERVIDERMKEA